MFILKIERVGGLAGFGLPDSHIASRGQMRSDELPEEDLEQVETLFNIYSAPNKKPSKSLMRDGFYYRISRLYKGVESIIEVPEMQMPASLMHCVKDELI